MREIIYGRNPVFETLAPNGVMFFACKLPRVCKTGVV